MLVGIYAKGVCNKSPQGLKLIQYAEDICSIAEIFFVSVLFRATLNLFLEF